MTQETAALASTFDSPARRGTLLHQLGVDTAYVLATLPWTLVGFVAVLVALSIALPLAPLGVGVPLTVAALATARGFAAVERGRLVRHDAATGRDPRASAPFTVPARPRPGYTAATTAPHVSRTGTWRRWSTALLDGQSWLDALHALTAWVLSLGSAVVLLTWWLGAVGGMSVWVWDRFLPAGGNDLGTVSGVARDALELVSSTGFRFAGGALLLLTIVPVTRALARMHAAYARVLLGDARTFPSTNMG